MTVDQGPVVVLDEILPLRRGSGDGPHIAVVMSLNFPDLIDSVAELVRRYGRSALQYLEDNNARWTFFDTSGVLPDGVSIDDFDGLLVLGGGDVELFVLGDERADPIDLRAVFRGAQQSLHDLVHAVERHRARIDGLAARDRKSTRLNSSHRT